MRQKQSYIKRWLITVVLLLSIIFDGFGQGALRIMALGNSLTVGENGEPNPSLQPPPEALIGYRYGLKYLLQQGGYNVDFVGSQTNGSAFFSDCQHAGIGGSRDQYVERLLIDGFDERNGVQILNPPRTYLDVYNPDIILLHIGTNDVTHESDLIANQRVSAILDQIDQYEIRAGKEVTVFLALIINRRLPCDAGSGCQTTKDWNAFIKSMAQARIANGDKLVIVDMENDAGIVYTNEDFYANDPDGLHLNPNGYGKMAALWYSSIVANINMAPSISPIPDQSISEDESFAVIPLDNYVYDLEDPDSVLNWTYNYLTTTNLQIIINQNREVTITPLDPNWTGEESIAFIVTDKGVNGSFQQSSSDTVVFRINAVNDPPVITGQKDLVTLEDNSIELFLSDFTVYDPDPDQSPDDQMLNVMDGMNYSLSGTTVIPDQDVDTDLNVNVSVSDVIGPGPIYQALVHITPVNDPPVYSGQSEISFNEDESFMMSLNYLDVHDADHNDSELQIVMKSGTNYAIDGDLITPKPNYFGDLYIETQIEDPLGAKSSIFNLLVTVKSVNDLPVFTTQPEDTAVVNESYIYPFNADDGDGEKLEYMVLEMPSWVTFYPNSRVIAGIPESKDVGYTHILIRATDGLYNVDQAFWLNVLPGTLGIVDIPFKDQPYLFPNPSGGQFTIHYENQKDPGTFRLYDQVGRQVANLTLLPDKNISFLSDQLDIYPGIYVYTIFNGVELYSGKLIIQSK